jgi:nucleoside-triphosphatase
MGQTLLLTGRPGIGKTTVIQEVIRALGDQAGGFYTEEMRNSDGRRTGFRMVTLGERDAVMAHVDLRGQGRPRVSRYGVDVAAIESVGVTALREAMASDRVVVVDEIGKMELSCDAFKDAVLEAIEGESRVIGTVMSGHNAWVDELKARDQVKTWEVTARNRDELPRRILRWLHVDAEAD